MRTELLRIVTYNIHKSRGLDTRMRPERIAEVLHSLDADVIALQEVVRGKGAADQLKVIEAELKGYRSCFGETRKIGSSGYGNAVLSRLHIAGHHHYDLTASWREDRGCLRADLELPNNKSLYLFNAHLGTGFVERRKQAQILMSEHLLNHKRFRGRRIVLGDFNEWTRGLCTRLLSTSLVSAHLHESNEPREEGAVAVRRPLQRKRQRSYPGMLPMMHLDHVYFDATFKLRNFKVHRTKLSLMASDHLPLVAEFELSPAA